jgi:hypothetical protein
MSTGFGSSTGLPLKKLKQIVLLNFITVKLKNLITVKFNKSINAKVNTTPSKFIQIYVAYLNFLTACRTF